MNTVEPMMGFGTFLLLFLFALWAGGAVEWVYRHWQKDKREREAMLQRSTQPRNDV